MLPDTQEGRDRLFANLMFDATIFGTSAVLQYEQMYRQAIDRSSDNYTGFFKFSHERDLAGPDYATFRVPNTDTLYSTAWIDLTAGPVRLHIPPTELQYFTLNIFDIFGNPENLSNRTIGFSGGNFLMVPPGWTGTVPEGLTLWRASTPHLWILMRVFAQSADEVASARKFQDGVAIEPLSATPNTTMQSDTPDRPVPPKPGKGPRQFLEVLDYVLRSNGCQPGEAALVSTFRPLGILSDSSSDGKHRDAVSVEAIERGFKDAQTLIENSKSDLGVPTGAGWVKVEKGNYGFNYLRRAVTNTAGLGANVREENASYTTFVDGSGETLDGSAHAYRLHLPTQPPVDAFWSVTLYDARTFALSPNPLGRYLISDRTSGLKVRKDGSLDIRIQHQPFEDGNWLPAPRGPFFIVLRAYSPKPEMLAGEWLPPAIEPLKP